MSASLLVDLRNTCDYRPSVSVGSGSNLIVGEIVDLMYANTYTNVFVAGGPASGPIELRIQTSDTTTSGSFTDPTSGFSANTFPVSESIVSGGILWANSGLWASGISSLSAPVNNAPLFCSGGVQFGAFLRPHRYARLLWNSGAFPNYATAGFLGNKKTTGSGGGFDTNPQNVSGNVVNV